MTGRIVTSLRLDRCLVTHAFTAAPTTHSASASVAATVPSKARGGSTALDRILSLRSSRACSSRRSTTPPPFSPPPPLPRPLPLPRVVVERSLAPLRSLAPPPPARLHDPRPRCVRSDDVAAQHRPRLSPPHRSPPSAQFHRPHCRQQHRPPRDRRPPSFTVRTADSNAARPASADRTTTANCHHSRYCRQPPLPQPQYGQLPNSRFHARCGDHTGSTMSCPETLTSPS